MGEEVEELVKRLRESTKPVAAPEGIFTVYRAVPLPLCIEAADTIDSLRASLTRVEEERDEARRERDEYMRLYEAMTRSWNLANEALSSLKGEALEAIEPLASAAPIWPEEYWADDYRTHDTRGCNFTIGEYRRAAALKQRLSRATSAEGK